MQKNHGTVLIQMLAVGPVLSLRWVLADLPMFWTSQKQFSVSILQPKVCRKYFLINYTWSTNVPEILLKNKLGQFRVIAITTSLPLTCIPTRFRESSHTVHSETHVTHPLSESGNTPERAPSPSIMCRVTSYWKERWCCAHFLHCSLQGLSSAGERASTPCCIHDVSFREHSIFKGYEPRQSLDKLQAVTVPSPLKHQEVIC